MWKRFFNFIGGNVEIVCVVWCRLYAVILWGFIIQNDYSALIGATRSALIGATRSGANGASCSAPIGASCSGANGAIC
jgi:hypothetical protein